MLKQRQDERPSPIEDNHTSELFACEQALGERDISTGEVAEGVVGGGNDGGLDGVYVFLGDVLLAEDSDVFQALSMLCSRRSELKKHLRKCFRSECDSHALSPSIADAVAQTGQAASAALRGVP